MKTSFYPCHFNSAAEARIHLEELEDELMNQEATHKRIDLEERIEELTDLILQVEAMDRRTYW